MFYLVFIIWNKTIICTCPVLLFFLVNYLFYRNIIKEEEKKKKETTTRVEKVSSKAFKVRSEILYHSG